MRTVRIIGLIAIVAASISCGDVVRQGRAPVFLVVDSLQASRGGTGAPSGFLLSDVVAVDTTSAGCSTTSPCQTFFDDTATAQFRVSLKDVGTPNALAAP